MALHLALLSLALAAPPAGDTSALACSVIQAAYTSATRLPRLAYPADLRAWSAPPDRLERYVEDYKKQMALKPGEFDDLRARQDRYPSTGFLPHCAWKGAPAHIIEGGDHMTASVSNPIFSSDQRLALVNISFFSSGRWGHGETCILRRTGTTWSARCLPGWIA